MILLSDEIGRVQGGMAVDILLSAGVKNLKENPKAATAEKTKLWEAFQ